MHHTVTTAACRLHVMYSLRMYNPARVPPAGVQLCWSLACLELNATCAAAAAVRVFLCPQVLYSKFGFMYTDLKLADEEFILIREDDVIGELAT